MLPGLKLIEASESENPFKLDENRVSPDSNTSNGFLNRAASFDEKNSDGVSSEARQTCNDSRNATVTILFIG